MIKITEETYNNEMFGGDLSSYMLYLYQQFSQYPLPTELDIPNEHWKPFIENLYMCCNLPYPTYNIKPELIKDYSEIEVDYNKVIVALSGGKDSTATLAVLKDEGKAVTAYFMKRANMSYIYEEDAATAIAESLNVPIIKDQLGRSGKTEWFKEVPVKNQLIMARILEYGLKHNCAVISCGEFVDGVTNEISDVQYDFTDNNDFTLLFEKAVQSHIPQFKYDYFLQAEPTGISYIINFHPELLHLVSSCIMPSRYLKQQQKYTEKYHLFADPDNPTEEGRLPHRCMNCYKCMAEWLYLVTWKKIPYNKEYIQQKLLPSLMKHRSEFDKKLGAKDPKDVTTKELLDSIIFTDYLYKYVKDPSLIKQDVHHRYKELIPKQN